MRGDQLAALIAPHLPDDLSVRVVAFHAGLVPPLAMRAVAKALPVGSVIVFIKSAANDLTAEHLEPLRRRRARIGLDSIDTPLDDIDFELYDFHIAASIAGRSALEERIQVLGLGNIPVELLHHHHDPRLVPGEMHDRPFRCGYVGELKNASIPPAIADRVECLDIRYPREFSRVLNQILEFTLHYGVRPESALPAQQFKPFTKGFTAAACNSNILINREADDAAALLGDDYPYLVSTHDPKCIVTGLERAVDGFGGAEWRNGLDRMRGLKDLVAPKMLAQRIQEIISKVDS